MQSKETSPPETSQYAIVVNSIGSSTLGSAAAVAKGLGITAAQVVNCLYKAPAVLVDKVEFHLAQQLTQLLKNIGYDVQAVTQENLPDYTKPQLYDIAVYLKDPAFYTQATKRLSEFIGMDETEASRMLLAPPGLVLGAVSQSSVDAFKHYMGDTLDIVAAPQAQASYDIFLGECAAIVKNRLLEDLQKAGIPVIANTGLIASGLSSDQVEKLWLRHKTNTNLRIVNQAFLRFDIALQPLPSEASATQKALLATTADIPCEYIDQVIADAPVTLLESIHAEQTAQLIETFHDAGLHVTAELISFQTLGLRIVQTNELSRTNQVLNQLGIDHQLRRIPEEIPLRFPETQARLLRTTLESTCATVEFIKG